MGKVKEVLLACPMRGCSGVGEYKANFLHSTIIQEDLIGCSERGCPLWRAQNWIESSAWQALALPRPPASSEGEAFAIEHDGRIILAGYETASIAESASSSPSPTSAPPSIFSATWMVSRQSQVDRINAAAESWAAGRGCKTCKDMAHTLSLAMLSVPDSDLPTPEEKPVYEAISQALANTRWSRDKQRQRAETAEARVKQLETDRDEWKQKALHTDDSLEQALKHKDETWARLETAEAERDRLREEKERLWKGRNALRQKVDRLELELSEAKRAPGEVFVVSWVKNGYLVNEVFALDSDAHERCRELNKEGIVPDCLAMCKVHGALAPQESEQEAPDCDECRERSRGTLRSWMDDADEWQHRAERALKSAETAEAQLVEAKRENQADCDACDERFEEVKAELDQALNEILRHRKRADDNVRHIESLTSEIADCRAEFGILGAVEALVYRANERGAGLQNIQVKIVLAEDLT